MSLALFTAAEPVGALRWRRSFPGEPAQAAVVRRFAGMLLYDWPTLDDVQLALDELVVNALRHTKSGQPGGTFTVEISLEGGMVSVAVTDQGGPTDPVTTNADDYAESGRGLRTVSATATSWGWFGNASSKTVTAVFSAHWSEL